MPDRRGRLRRLVDKANGAAAHNKDRATTEAEATAAARTACKLLGDHWEELIAPAQTTALAVPEPPKPATVRHDVAATRRAAVKPDELHALLHHSPALCPACPGGFDDDSTRELFTHEDRRECREWWWASSPTRGRRRASDHGQRGDRSVTRGNHRGVHLG
jgi:hypothetical protein